MNAVPVVPAPVVPAPVVAAPVFSAPSFHRIGPGMAGHEGGVREGFGAVVTDMHPQTPP